SPDYALASMFFPKAVASLGATVVCCEDSKTAAKIGLAKVATWTVGKLHKGVFAQRDFFTPYLVTLGTQNLFGTPN
ncbi:hypothetical protein AVEN_238837-1, partial [Araneus ventricosus]